MKFVIKFKRGLFWQSRSVIGYRHLLEQDRMILFFEDGSLEEVPAWSKHRVKLGTDWVLAMQKKMEKDSGTSIPVNVS